MEKGFIKLFHKFCEWEWYDNPNAKVLFIHLLLRANIQTKQWQGITIKRGQLVTSVEKLAVANGLTTQQIRTALRNLQTTKEIEIETTKKYSIITVKNYNLYQVPNKQITKPKSSNNGSYGGVGFSNLTNKQQSANKVANKQITKLKPSDIACYGGVDFSNLTNKLTTTKDNNSNTSYINISLSSKKITKEERDILTNYVKKHNLAKTSVRAYVNAIIKNGDYVDILEAEQKKQKKQKTKPKNDEVFENTQEDEKHIAEVQKRIKNILSKRRSTDDR